MQSEINSYGKHYIDQDDIDHVVEVLQSSMLTQGPLAKEFEKKVADYLCKNNCQINNQTQCYGIACSSGTAALHLACLSLNICRGDVVIVPSITFVASANAVAMVGAKVVFCDVRPDTGLLDVHMLDDALMRAKKIGNPKAIISVHLNGQMADMGSIAVFADKHELFVIEDACHAIGGEYLYGNQWYKTGNALLSDVVCFSFHPVKNITTGEGGMLVTQNNAIAQCASKFAQHGIVRTAVDFQNAKNKSDPWYYEMHDLGYNYRLSDIQSALGISQLRKLDNFVARRRDLVDTYRQHLQGASDILKLLSLYDNQKPAWHLMVVLIDFANCAIDRATLMQELMKESIGTQVHYIPVHEQPYWKVHSQTPRLKGCAQYYESTLSLPLFFNMCADDVKLVCDKLLTLLVTK